MKQPLLRHTDTVFFRGGETKIVRKRAFSNAKPFGDFPGGVDYRLATGACTSACGDGEAKNCPVCLGEVLFFPK